MTLEKGDYVLTYVTDRAHSFADWADSPPYDPYGWGVSISVARDADVKKLKDIEVPEIQSPIVRFVKIGDNESKSEGFSLKAPATLRTYAFGERANSRRQMADYATILDAKTREKVWAMTVERTMHAGGASKNRYVDEILALPKGSYIVQYVTDDTHSYQEWNDDPPFDPENYGITIMGWGPNFSSAIVGKYVEERNTDVIASKSCGWATMLITQNGSLSTETPECVCTQWVRARIGNCVADIAFAQAGRLKVIKVDLDAESGLALLFSVQTAPTFLTFRDTKQLGRLDGAPREASELAQWVQASMS